MHELSIASSILELARKHVPRGLVLLSVKVQAGPMRGIDPDAMELAWRACATLDESDIPIIDLELLPWRLLCPDCGREYTAETAFAPCRCGGVRAQPIGGDELSVVSIEVDEPVALLEYAP